MKRNPHTPDKKAKLVLEALSGERTINEIASEHNAHPSMLTRWKKEAIAGLPSIFANDASKKRKEKKAHDAEMDELYAQIGKLTTQIEWLKKIWPLSFPPQNGDAWSNLEMTGFFLSRCRQICCPFLAARCIIDLSPPAAGIWR